MTVERQRKCLLLMIFFAFGICCADAAYLRIYCGENFDEYDEFDLESPLGLLDSTGYDESRHTVIYTFGFQGKANGQSVKTIVETYLRIGNINIILFNWEKEATTPLGAISYGTIVAKTVNKLGTKLGDVLVSLVSAGLDINKVHLIGFSLGAQLFGYTGRQVIRNNFQIQRITGLDPAGPLYDGKFFESLDEDSASFVDVFHTNPSGLGSHKSQATIDIWFNCERKYQPGCEVEDDPVLCSHDRSWKYYSEGLENPNSFQAVSASGCLDWLHKDEDGQVIYIGGNSTLNYSGDFYLSTYSKSPYSKGADGVYKNSCTLQ
ncbi:phospholipase A1 VesT1.02-like [Danaus plexippus]|uniref:phospholipase A1 VesT1.02-like n=1 Tax=Danaus plexippus TaxID=13037 RepID=UPI002AB261A5|nr:phospholipase A1 VesT1.02-like [Danaus plexippus]